MEAEFPSHVKEGDVLAGKYRVEKILGAGGMGVVVAAKHMQLGQRVAIKFLLPHSLGNTEVMGRFQREAQAAAHITSEHVARVLDVGTLESGAPFMVIEYLQGRDLGSWLARSGALPIEQAVDFVLQAIEAIAEAHSLGIVHRDLKPANLYCVRRADDSLLIKVLDFGISKIQHHDSVSPGMDLTRTTTVIGSPFYMSPEQLRSSRDVDGRTDIWSLGVILFQLLSGKLPFTANGLPELVIKITNESPQRLRSLRSEVPAGLEQVIDRCLKKDRTQRYSNVADLAVALAPFGSAASARASAERAVRILRSAEESRSTLTPDPGNHGSIPIEAAWGNTASPSHGVKRWLPLAVAGGFGVVAALALTWPLMHASQSASPLASRPEASVISAPIQPATSPSDSTLSSAATSASVAVPPDPMTKPGAATTAPTKKSVKVTPARGLDLGRAVSTAPTPMSSSADPACKRSYTLDKDGNVQFKPSCI